MERRGVSHIHNNGGGRERRGVIDTSLALGDGNLDSKIVLGTEWDIL
jgi:hypothetical protein